MFAILVVVFMIVSENKHFVQPPQFPGFGGIFPDILPYVCTYVHRLLYEANLTHFCNVWVQLR